MAGTGRSMLLSLLLFAVTLSLLEMYRGWFAASELKTIAGGFVSSLLFLLLLTSKFCSLSVITKKLVVLEPGGVQLALSTVFASQHGMLPLTYFANSLFKSLIVVWSHDRTDRP
ncbi:hypothetical protein TRIUR3_05097 [Triticum urartu]|uniref:Uncharacterized protein n=1 Tax=Triticum urartu TaxID=4572 RepID=M8AEP7_TRIUA|nr:hypothetical protein TRIUR3_05097 [Triticum urartu]